MGSKKIEKTEKKVVKRVVRKVAKSSEPEGLLYFLRTCQKDGTSYKGTFKWNLELGAKNTAPDWSPEPECGKGLHGLLGGQGESEHLDWSEDASWVVFSSPTSVDLNGKHKVQTATICAVGDRKTATDFLLAKGFQGVHGSFPTAGDNGTATAGDNGTATAGYYGTATAGYYGTATAGDGGTVSGGEKAVLSLKYWNGERYRIVLAYVGENGIKPNTKYKLNDKYKFTEVK